MTRTTITPSSAKRDTYHVGNLAPQLLSAAREMLEAVGPAKLSLRAVSERVGVSSTAAYHHFANRSVLVGHLAAQGFRELTEALSHETAQPDKLQQASLAYFRFARGNPALYQLMFGAECLDAEALPALLEARAEAFGRLEQTLAETLELPLDSSQVRGAALASWSYIHGLASLLIHGVMQVPEGVSDERLVEMTLLGFLNIYRARTGE
ncbi:MAG: TetR/AcrR family transcriptional regulator [Pseudomonas sp.]|uniref:TetR/AcrR family transcriptional regulator n=1 Tax=Pseudomonas sp. TaxID=306 RepID=UPI0033968843